MRRNAVTYRKCRDALKERKATRLSKVDETIGLRFPGDIEAGWLYLCHRRRAPLLGRHQLMPGTLPGPSDPAREPRCRHDRTGRAGTLPAAGSGYGQRGYTSSGQTKATQSEYRSVTARYGDEVSTTR
jgi:hypothetical protein